MELFCLGLSHKSAPLAVRERFALSDASQLELLQTLAPAPVELLLVSTCNRVELFFAAPEAGPVREQALAHLIRLGGPDTLQHLYEHEGEAALLHLFRVASSLDSMVLGEAQILGQVKEALERAQAAGVVRGELSRVGASALGCAKRVRTETQIGRATLSMASAAVSLASKVFDGLKNKVVLLVGAGEMAELAGRHLRSAGASTVFITNRTFARAESLALEVGGSAQPFESLDALLVQADVVVCSTASPVPIFTKERVQAVAKARKHRPLFMVDLAVPRDIAPEVGQLDWVHAYDLDDIQKFVAENAAARASEAEKAALVVMEEVARYMRDRAVREGVPVLARLRAQAEQIARNEVARTLSSMGETLNERQRKSIEAMGMAIVNKLLHAPTTKLRAVPPAEEGNRLAGAAAELFGLDETSSAAGGVKR